MKYLAIRICGIGIIVSWNALAALHDHGKLIDIEYRTVHKLYCIQHPTHHHCQ